MSWVDRLFSLLSRRRTTDNRKAKRREGVRRQRLHLEALEDRCLLASLLSATLDAPTGVYANTSFAVNTTAFDSQGNVYGAFNNAATISVAPSATRVSFELQASD